MPEGFWIIIIALAVFAWFLLGEKTTFKEKITLIAVCIFIYVFYKFLNGKNLQEIMHSAKELISG